MAMLKLDYGLANRFVIKDVGQWMHYFMFPVSISFDINISDSGELWLAGQLVLLFHFLIILTQRKNSQQSKGISSNT